MLSENDLKTFEMEVEPEVIPGHQRLLNLKQAIVIPAIESSAPRTKLAIDALELKADDPQAEAERMLGAIRTTINSKWFWYAIASSLCWTAWAFTAKLGSREIPPATMEFISAFGFVVVGIFVMGTNRGRPETSPTGKILALISGVLLAFGGICLFSAYRTGYSASIITSITSLYPVVTVLLALTFLREKLNKAQALGFCFAAAAIVLLSL